jgi:hypothetical protein
VKRRTLGLLIVVAAIVFASVVAAQDVVELRLRGHYFAEPATVDITVIVEPSPDNRVLRVEADGDRMYRSTEVELSGATDSRVHLVEFKNLEAGSYRVRAEVLSASKVRGQASSVLTVTGQ